MRINIGTKISPIIRILSFFLALIILSITFENGFVNISTSVNAENSDYDGLVIHSDTKETTNTIKNNLNLKASANSSIFTYTGKMTRADVELFDYVSDYEINNNSYNQITHTEGGYDDAYTKLNSKISNEGLTETVDNTKISFRFKTAIRDVKDIKIYLYDGSSHNTGWNNNPMIYDYSTGEYVKTFVYNDLNFTPTKYKIHGNSDSYGNWETNELTCGSTLDAGKVYSLNDCVESNGMELSRKV